MGPVTQQMEDKPLSFVLIAARIWVANRFGKGLGSGLGLTFLAPIFFPLLAFRD